MGNFLSLLSVMSDEIQKPDFYKSFVFKIANSLAGSRKDLSLSLGVSLTAGFIYTFKIWDQPALLIVFGIILPSIYTITLYKLFKAQNIISPKQKFFKLAKTNTGNTILLFIDIIILIITGLLVIYGPLDFIFVRFIVVIIIPIFYLLTIHGIINNPPIDEDN